MTIIVKSVRDVKKNGRPVAVNGFSPALVRELLVNGESLVAVYRDRLSFRRTAQVITDRCAYESMKGKTAFGSIKGLRFYASKIGIEPYRNLGIEAFMAAPARSVA